MRVPGSGSHPVHPRQVGTRDILLVGCGDTLVFLLFSLTGRSAHGDVTSPVGVVGTALPFIAGWFLVAIPLGAYRREVPADLGESMQRTTRAWLGGSVIGLVARSIIEHHIVPGAFIAVTVAFNLLLLLAWRAAMVVFLARRVRPA